MSAGTLSGPPAAWKAKAAVILAQHARAVLDDHVSTPAYVTHAIVLSCCPHIADDAELLRLWEAYLDRVRAEIRAEEDALPGDDAETAREVARQDSADGLEALLGRQS